MDVNVVVLKNKKALFLPYASITQNKTQCDDIKTKQHSSKNKTTQLDSLLDVRD